MGDRRRWAFALACGGALLACPTPGLAVNLVLDYTYDTQNFFGGGNPGGAAAGAQAKAALEAAAAFFSDLLEDSFSPIVTPPDYASQVFSGVVTWDWQRRITHPGTGGNLQLSGPIAQDEYLIYAGGRSLSGNTLGRGGPGGFGWSSDNNGGFFTAGEIDEIQAITDAFELAVEDRGEPSGFAQWGGAITFDNDGSADWHYDHTNPPAGNDDDFFSVALHELGHALGLGASDQWNALLSDGKFTGAKAVASFGGPIPATVGHFADGTMSVLRGTDTVAEAAMDPIITAGTRKVFTELDIAALEDLGWDIAPLVAAQVLGDYNDSGLVEQGDLDQVLSNWGAGFASIPGTWANQRPTSGIVDQAELDVVLSRWGAVSAPDFSGGAVPEPASMVMLALTGGVFRRRR